MTDRYDEIGWAGGEDAVLWQCLDCGAAVVQREDHERFHGRLVELETELARITYQQALRVLG